MLFRFAPMFLHILKLHCLSISNSRCKRRYCLSKNLISPSFSAWSYYRLRAYVSSIIKFRCPITTIIIIISLIMMIVTFFLPHLNRLWRYHISLRLANLRRFPSNIPLLLFSKYKSLQSQYKRMVIKYTSNLFIFNSFDKHLFTNC